MTTGEQTCPAKDNVERSAVHKRVQGLVAADARWLCDAGLSHGEFVETMTTREDETEGQGPRPRVGCCASFHAERSLKAGGTRESDVRLRLSERPRKRNQDGESNFLWQGGMDAMKRAFKGENRDKSERVIRVLIKVAMTRVAMIKLAWASRTTCEVPDPGAIALTWLWISSPDRQHLQRRRCGCDESLDLGVADSSVRILVGHFSRRFHLNLGGDAVATDARLRPDEAGLPARNRRALRGAGGRGSWHQELEERVLRHKDVASKATTLCHVALERHVLVVCAMLELHASFHVFLLAMETTHANPHWDLSLWLQHLLGRYRWAQTLGSTIFGVGVVVGDTLYPLLRWLADAAPGSKDNANRSRWKPPSAPAVNVKAPEARCCSNALLEACNVGAPWECGKQRDVAIERHHSPRQHRNSEENVDLDVADSSARAVPLCGAPNGLGLERAKKVEMTQSHGEAVTAWLLWKGQG
ncbi:hypothetical protein IE81DRAFT_329709 [Ceraceosorus guamensis]|uniref:Uncharacterized protein n=1 Tax=Ceraceosorus guamensis TaxID=1522189 RepID=A0A316W149_9BASI|nr:hypothetical protein IE81DRAFT_329709 [Ceraceosorus guamensis]PWN43224.1 hypothetical protein IE81DRAFT_329709 [Ceraceosorus guamensis]